jgi:5-methylcytosine-specific restriction endonuclease McrA
MDPRLFQDDKKFSSLYRQYSYKLDPLYPVLKRAGVDVYKLTKYDFNMFIDPNYSNVNTLTKYLVYHIKGIVKGIDKGKVDPFTIIQKFSDNDIIQADLFLAAGKIWRTDKVDPYISLIETLVCFKLPKYSHKALLKSISTCPPKKVFSLDFGLIIDEGIPVNHKNPVIPVISENIVIYLYICEMLFGIAPDDLFDWLMIDMFKGVKERKYLCIDNGQFFKDDKAKGYPHIDEKNRLVSSKNDIINYSGKIIARYIKENSVICIDKDSGGESSNVKRKEGPRKAIPKPVRNQVWKHHFGDKMKGKCYCCKTKIGALESWEAGHVIAHVHGGSDTADNLRPICSTCNKSMGAMNMDDFVKQYFKK